MNEDPVNRCAVAMMIVEMVKFVKVLSARQDVARMTIVLIIWRASINSALIHVPAVQLAAQMLNVDVSIIRSNVRVLHLLLAMQTLDVNSRLLSAANTTIVHQITLAMEMYARRHAVAIKIACLMNDAYVEFAELFAIVTLRVDRDKFAKTVSVKSDAEVIMCVRAITHVSTINVPIHVQRLVNVAHVQSVPLSIMVFNAVALLASSETPYQHAHCLYNDAVRIVNVTKPVCSAQKHATRTMNAHVARSVLAANAERNVILEPVLPVNCVKTEPVLPVAVRIWIVPATDLVSMDSAWIRVYETTLAVRMPSAKYPNTEQFACVPTASKANRSRAVYPTNVKRMKTVNQRNYVTLVRAKTLVSSRELAV